VTGKISIVGPIGAVEENGKMAGVLLINVISQVKALPAGTQIIEVNISSPGGLVDEGDNIYNYLESLKKDFVVNTVQIGHIASIATKLFLVGTSRVADRAFDFMIHNPWVDPGPGDSNHQADILESLLASEASLRKFYSKVLNITEEGLTPLMDQETTITPDQLVSLGFATSLKNNQLVMAMKTEKKEKSLTDRIKALAESVGIGKIKGMDVALMDGRMLVVEAPSEDDMVGAAATIDGAPAPDADYQSAPDAAGVSDVITVKGGKVTAVAEAPMAVEQNAKIEALEKNLASLTDAVSALVEAAKGGTIEASVKESEKKFAAQIMALRTEIGTTHEPKKGAVVYAQSVAKEQSSHRSISQVMAEKAEARKKQLNGN